MTTAPPPDDDPRAGDDAPSPAGGPLSDAEVDRRFADLTGVAGPPAPGHPYPDATGVRATQELSGRVVRGAGPLAGSGPRDITVDDAEEDEGYVPPEPAPVEITDPRRLAAGLLALAPALVALVSVLTGTWLSTLTWSVLVVLFVGGVVWFVSLLPSDRDPGDPGAVV